MQDQLPDVTIRIGQRTYRAMLSGRSHPYALATILLPEGERVHNGQRARWHQGRAPQYEYAWSTIVRSLNTGQALLV